MKNSKKLLISVCLMLVAVFAATSTTFAWFALNNTADVQSFDMEITSGDNSLVLGVESYVVDATFTQKATITQDEKNALPEGSVKTSYGDTLTCTPGAAINLDDYKDLAVAEKAVYTVNDADNATEIVYYNSLTNEILLTAKEFVDSNTVLSEGSLSTKMNHVTYNNGFYTTTENETDYSSTANLTTAKANVDYLSFTLHFKSTGNSNQNVYLLNSSAVSDTNAEGKTVKAWRAIDANEFATAHDSFALNADITVNACNAVRVAFTDSETKIWDPNADKGYTINGDEGMAHDWLESFKNADITFGNGPTANLNVADNPITNTPGATPIAVLSAGSGTFAVGAARIDIWLEGTDGECFNVIYEDAFSTVLNFISNTAE